MAEEVREFLHHLPPHHLWKNWGWLEHILFNEHDTTGIPPAHHIYLVNILLVITDNKIQYDTGLAKKLILKKDAIPTIYLANANMKHPPSITSATINWTIFRTVITLCKLACKLLFWHKLKTKLFKAFKTTYQSLRIDSSSCGWFCSIALNHKGAESSSGSSGAGIDCSKSSVVIFSSLAFCRF